MENIDIRLQGEAILPGEAITYVSGESCGGINVFIGTVRNQTKGKAVVRLEFEAYEKMAVREMEKIARQVLEKWPVEKIALHHRVGTLYPGDIAVVIAVAAPHRGASFAACQYAIDTLKETVPIWKKEIFEDGEVWVAAHP
ncbi:MAG: molybdenum cofactor biosynthesis protein MoaE [Bacteroidia bacterium]|nr:molybdenum cofactor biosynthesis protein MoaE [Bacteroidia bacterium]